MYLEIAYIVLGIVLLMLGRKLFWLFAGMTGFVIGIEYAGLLLPGKSDKVVLIAALICAIIGLILAFVVQKIGLAIAGFLAGGYVSLMLIKELGFQIAWLPWVIFISGGILGIILILVVFDWALIILSSFIGAFLIIQSTGFNLYLTKILFVILTSIGIITQITHHKEKA
ncbi:MAG: hypothetical protein KJ915_13220 [Candidatus Omnitrophica bacterium]|nr:hypothetical protein [Candidatus Omnitrophota bacterium]